MAVVAGAMMMVVGDSAARAFGIFAAASLVRSARTFVTPKRDYGTPESAWGRWAPASGRWDMAVILTLVCPGLSGNFEYFEQSQVFRSMEVVVEPARRADHEVT